MILFFIRFADPYAVNYLKGKFRKEKMNSLELVLYAHMFRNSI